jgi:hypothetical protein
VPQQCPPAAARHTIAAATAGSETGDVQTWYALLTGIPARLTELRGPELTQRQLALASAWAKVQADQETQRQFDDAFDRVLEIDRLNKALENLIDQKERSRDNGRTPKKIRGLESKLTPVAKAAAISREPHFYSTALQYFRETNGDTNISRCIKYLDKQGVGKNIQPGAKRVRIKAFFGIVGRRGRPRGS